MALTKNDLSEISKIVDTSIGGVESRLANKIVGTESRLTKEIVGVESRLTEKIEEETDGPAQMVANLSLDVTSHFDEVDKNIALLQHDVGEILMKLPFSHNDRAQTT